MSDNKPGLLTPSVGFKPFRYEWAFEAYQQQQRIHWLPEEVPMADDVKDWQNKLTPAEKNLLTQILRFFTQGDVEVANNYMLHYMPVFKPVEVLMMLAAFTASECFDRDSEILTDSGWKNCSEITIADKVAQYDFDTKEISFAHPSRVLAYPYSGVLHLYKNKSTNICVTPNHDLIVQHPSTRKTRKAKSYENKWGGNYLYPSCGRKASYESDIPVLDRLKIAVAADGTMRVNCPSTSQRNRTVDLHLKKPRKIERLKWLLTENGLSTNERIMSDTGFSKFTFQFPGSDDISGLKTLDFIRLDGMTPEVALGYVNEILKWDGSETGCNPAFYSTEKSAIDKFQALCVLAGLSAGITVNYPERKNCYFPLLDKHLDLKTCWVVTVSERAWRTYPYRKEVDYDGDVYCVTVPKGNVVSRRNGRVAITGNSNHVHSYSHLIDTLGLPETEYSAFLKYSEMKNKQDYFKSFNADNPREIAKTLAAFGAFTEGASLFASFSMLLNFQRFGKLKSVGQIIAWSIRDESLHCQSIIKLFHAFCEEHPGLFDDALRADILEICKTTVEHEDAFIDLAFEMGPVEGMTPDDIKQYVRYICDRRLLQLGMAPHYGVKENPLPWVEDALNLPSHENFFETRATEYSKAATKGEWFD